MGFANDAGMGFRRGREGAEGSDSSSGTGLRVVGSSLPDARVQMENRSSLCQLIPWEINQNPITIVSVNKHHISIGYSEGAVIL